MSSIMSRNEPQTTMTTASSSRAGPEAPPSEVHQSSSGTAAVSAEAHDNRDRKMAWSEQTLFIEREEVFHLISILTVPDDYHEGSNNGYDTDTGGDSDKNSADEALAKLRTIYDRYLECPTLLDPYLECMTSQLSTCARDIIQNMFFELCPSASHDGSKNDSNYKQKKRRQLDKLGVAVPGGSEDSESTDNGRNYGIETDEIKGDTKSSNGPSLTSSTIQQHQRRRLQRLLSAIYALSKVRGRKRVQKFLPHDVSDVEPVLFALRTINDANQNHQKEHDEDEVAKTWESIYTLLLWLGMLSLVPFSLNVIDSSYTSDIAVGAANMVGATNDSEDTSKVTLITSILSTAKSHLSDAGPTREVATSCLASLLSRPDLDTKELESFVLWSNDILKQHLDWITATEKDVSSSSKERQGEDEPTANATTSIFLVMGVIQTLASIFKTATRSHLIQKHLRCIEILWERAILVAEYASPNNNESNSKGGKRGGNESGGAGGTILLRKLLVKLFARVGCAYLPPRVASWRYQRGRRSLLENLNSAKGGFVGSTTAVTVPTASSQCSSLNKQIGPVSSVPSRDGIGSAVHSVGEDVIFPIPDQVEDAMAQLIHSLSDPSTVVRWSAAKGVGRVTERLPSICADDVLDGILELCADGEKDNAWHGACLALAELARRGLLLPKRLEEVVPYVVRAIQYDVRRGQTSVGSHVRDAACYTCWAFARAYAPTVLKPYVPDLGQAMVLASLFDREVNCRRAASAAFQECVGRQGADNFKHGIAILTTADYFSLGNRIDAFTTVACKIAEFEEYRKPIICHLYEVKLFHWDVDIRTLASKSLYHLTALDTIFMADTVVRNLLPLCTDENLVVRHGAVLGLAEILLALGEIRDSNNGNSNDLLPVGLSEESASSIAELVPCIEKARLYRGRGGESMRAAVSRLIECLSLARLPLSVRQQVRLLDSVDACLKHPKEDVQSAAAAALGALTRSYFPVGVNGPSERLQNRVVNKYVTIVNTDENPAATRGFALALGYLPHKLLAPKSEVIDSVLDCLCKTSRLESKVGDEGDAETRRNSIFSLTAVCETVGIGLIKRDSESTDACPMVGLNKAQVAKVFQTFLYALEDYNTDRRGDVGSWSRIAAMSGLEKLIYIAVKASVGIPQYLPSSQRSQVLNSKTGGSKLHPSSLTSKLVKSNIRGLAVPSVSDRFSYLESNAAIRVKCSLMASEPFRKENVWNDALNGSTYFDDRMCARVIGALLKQLSEKLDVVRSHAGSCLERILLREIPKVPFVPDRSKLEEALGLNQQGKSFGEMRRHTNWASPAVTFPMVMRAVNIDDFFEDIMSGMIISVGGLTESVTKHSSAALLEWFRSVKNFGLTSKIKALGNLLLSLFERHHKDGRVILPLLKSLDKLLTHRCLDELLDGESSSFATGLLFHLKKETRGCTDVHRLLAIVSVSMDLLNSQQTALVQDAVLPFIMRMLGHQYPRVRRFTAEQLYVRLLEDGSMIKRQEGLDDAMQLLLQVAWDGDLEFPGNVRESRNQVADLIGVELPANVRDRPMQMKKTSSVVDEFESYGSLINAVGR